MPLDQFNLFKLSYYKQHLLKLINIVAKKKSFQFQFVNQQCLKSNMQGIQPNCRKHRFMLFPSLKMTFDIFCIHMKPLKNKKFLVDKLFHWFIYVCCHFNNVKIIIFIKTLANSDIFKQGVQMMINI
jgi:hypothetical protein